MGSQFHQIGNSVPPPLAYALGLSLRDCLGIKSDANWKEYSNRVLTNYVY